MKKQTLTGEDKAFLQKKDISEDELQKQLNCFEKGFPYLELSAAASAERGVRIISSEEEKNILGYWDAYKTSGKKIMKFVPASGAASRMFKDLFEFLDASYDVPTTEFEKTFFNNLDKFAFYEDLDAICLKNERGSLLDLLKANRYKTIVANLLNADGLSYGILPKGLLKFHKYEFSSCTAAEEHLKEGLLYTQNNRNEINIHFTVSPEHRVLFKTLIEEKVPDIEQAASVRYDVSFSEQKSNTDTIAVDANNEPFRANDGMMTFRPGGHGALIENLNDLDADVVFIKNIDNVVPDRYKEEDAKYKRMLAGVLVKTQESVFHYLNLLEGGKYTREQLLDVLCFLQETLLIKNPETKFLEDAELVLYLKRKLNRPCRVCGMVRNVGEPGGGPFLAINDDATISPQILESSQIDMNDPIRRDMFQHGTYFNPVDLVCAIKDYKGNSFDLRKFVDRNTGFISVKSKSGKELKALELPGLWNGAMSDWNTIFVEVPVSTFNPVKTINDLLRENHLS